MAVGGRKQQAEKNETAGTEQKMMATRAGVRELRQRASFCGRAVARASARLVAALSDRTRAEREGSLTVLVGRAERTSRCRPTTRRPTCWRRATSCSGVDAQELRADDSAPPQLPRLLAADAPEPRHTRSHASAPEAAAIDPGTVTVAAHSYSATLPLVVRAQLSCPNRACRSELCEYTVQGLALG